MTRFALLVMLLLVPGYAWAQECSQACPEKVGWNLLGKDARVTYDQRVCAQNCRIANALEALLEKGEK